MRTFGNLLAFSPELWLLLGAIVVFALARFVAASTSTAIGLITVALAFLALTTQFKQTITILDGVFLLDGYAIVIDVLILAAAALALLASRADVLPGEGEQAASPGFYLLATLGAMLAASAAEMVSLFIALELLAVSLYLVAALTRRGYAGMAASLGYLAIGVASSGLLLYGLALLFGFTGNTQLRAAGAALAQVKPDEAAVMLLLSLLIGGFAVRIGLIPIRWWVRGFEVGVTLRGVLFIESVGVVAGLAVLGRLLASTFAGTRIPYAALIAGLAAAAMTAGNVLAVTQNSLRRMLVFSSVAQAGFALMAFTDVKRVGLSALVVFLVASVLTTIAAYASVIGYSRSVHSDAVRDLAGMSRWSPGLALALALALLSLAGMPPLAGFLGKLLLIQAAVDGGFTWLAIIAAFNIVIGALGYLRVIRAAFIEPPVYEVQPVRLDAGIRTALGAACIGVVFMGLVLEPLYRAASYGSAALLH
jgi:NADH-quinone oxidoreductase subunit N